MPAQVVGDTNLFYYIESGRVDVARILEAGDTLRFSPLSVIEIVSKMDAESYERRKGAVRAIIQSGAMILPDPQSFLTHDIFEHALNTEPVDWAGLMQTVVDSSDLDGLSRGVPNLRDMTVRTVSINYLHQWREVIDTQWKEDLLDLLRDNIENYDEVYQALRAGRPGAPPRLRGDRRNRFIDFINSPEWYIEQIHALYQRSLHYAAIPYRPYLTGVSATTVLPMIDKLGCYMSMYSRYIHRLLIEGAFPNENDSGDIELFLYSISDEFVVATAERLWNRLATEAGYGNRVRLVHP
jgi:hypothetical protein